MKTSSKTDGISQPSSNLRRGHSASLLAYRAKLHAERSAVYERKARQFGRAVQKIFSKADVRVAAEIVAGVRKEYEDASLRAGHAASKRDALKAAAQKKLNRLLAKALPAFGKFQSIKQAHLREHAVLTDAVLTDSSSDELTVYYGNTPLEGPAGAQDFVAPFQIFDSRSDDPSHLIDHGGSFANLAFSQAGNALFFEHDGGSILDFSPWGLNFTRVHSASSFAGCGINFTLPATGRLQIRGLLQNIANRCSFSVSDNWGFSYGNLDVRLLLFISVIRGGVVSHLTRTLLANGLRSSGDDLSYTMPVLFNALPYRVLGATAETYAAGESVQILVGTEVQIDSEMDDMESKVNALMLWRLEKISVAVL